MVIPLSKPYMSQEIIYQILRVVNSGQYILGNECMKFEKEFAEYVGTKHAALTSSGTSAIFLSLKALGIGMGDEVLVPSLTAFPTVEAILHAGAKPVFVDVTDTYGINLKNVTITDRTKAVIPVHLYGNPVDMDFVLGFAVKHDLFVIEDCCQAHGAKYHDSIVGSMGTVGCFSFYPSKNMTVYGDGGAITTKLDYVAENFRMLRDHGRRTKYEHEIVGYNLRFNEIQAVVGRLQLAKLDLFNSSRRDVAKWYGERLAGLPLKIPRERPSVEPVYHLYVIEAEERDRLAEYLKSKGIQTGIHYPIPCHLQLAITDMWDCESLPVTETVAKRILSLPMYPELTVQEVTYICDSIREFYAKS